MCQHGLQYKSHGNCSPVAEYNYWCDPHAAEIVYRAFEELPILQNKKIHMVGLDVTRTIVLTPDLLEYMCYVNPAIGERIQRSPASILISLETGRNHRPRYQSSPGCRLFYGPHPLQWNRSLYQNRHRGTLYGTKCGGWI